MPSVMETVKRIVEKLKQIIREQLGVEEDEITPTASFVEDLGSDSLDTVELVMAVEEAFDIEIPDKRCREDAYGTGSDRLHRKAFQEEEIIEYLA